MKLYRIVYINNHTKLRHTKFVYEKSPREAVRNYREHNILSVQEIPDDDCRSAIRINEKEWK